MKYRLLLYFNYLKKIFRSPSRLMLTVSGLSISMIILMIGLIYSETYMRYKLSGIEIYNTNKIFMYEGTANFELYNLLKNVDEANTCVELVGKSGYTVKEVEKNNRKISVSLVDIKTNARSNNFYVGSGYELCDSNILYGRMINVDDINANSNNTVISDLLSVVLFGKENSVGEVIYLPVYEIDEQTGSIQIKKYESLKIIGVYRESARTAQNNKKIINGESKEEILKEYIYIPLTLNLKNKVNSDYQMRITKFGIREYTDTLKNYEKIIKYSETSGNYVMYDYYNLKDNLSHEIEEIKSTLAYIVMGMLIISAICIINTMLFSVKERINEIGIRKSIGAYNIDIIGQFVFEGVVYGIIGAVIGIVFSSIISSALYWIIGLKDNWGVNMCISGKAMVLSLAVAILLSMISSIIPAIYASKINISDSIRHE